MKYDDFKFTTEDNQEVFACCWQPEKSTKPKAVVQIAHGMAEHITRYSRFASKLVEHGYLVYGNDHRGHGKTAGVLENVGFFAPENGFNLVVEDMIHFTSIIKERHPELPVFLMGHSMGSLLTRNYLTRQGQLLKGAILSGTIAYPGVMGKLGLAIAKLESKIKGKKAKSPLLDKLSFGQYNNRFKPNRTKFDWLSRDHQAVDMYIDDPYCGTIFSAGFFVDLLSGIYDTFDPANLSKTPKELPLLLFSGEKDPVGGAGGVNKVYKSYLGIGLEDVSIKLYPDGRHEMLNEINREEVFNDVIDWLNQHIS